MREIVFDTETTGLEFGTDRVVEIGAVELIDLIPTGKTFHTYINPQMKVAPDAFKIHGLSNDFLKTKPTFKRVVDRFLRFIGDDRLVAHNSEFDIAMINAELRRLELPQLANPVVNTLKLAREVKKGGLHNLDTLARHYGVDISKRDLHGALLDSHILAKVYLELRGGRQFGLSLQTEVVPVATERLPAVARPGSLSSRLNAEAIETHRVFVESLGQSSIWSRYLHPAPSEGAEETATAA